MGEVILLEVSYSCCLLHINYSCVLMIVLDDEIGGYLRCMKKSWPFGLKENTFVVLKAYLYPGKVKDLTKWYMQM